jgi:ATP-dependent Zn protease
MIHFLVAAIDRIEKRFSEVLESRRLPGVIKELNELRISAITQLKEYSEHISSQIDAEVRKIMNTAHQTAQQVLSENKKVLEVIANRLIEVENIEREEYEQILTAHGIKFKNEEVI